MSVYDKARVSECRSTGCFRRYFPGCLQSMKQYTRSCRFIGAVGICFVIGGVSNDIPLVTKSVHGNMLFHLHVKASTVFPRNEEIVVNSGKATHNGCCFDSTCFNFKVKQWLTILKVSLCHLDLASNIVYLH